MVRYIVGIDYGHGETTAACIDLEAQNTPIIDLNITGNETKIHSMMVKYTIDGEWILAPSWSSLKYSLVPENMQQLIPPFAAYFKGPVSPGRDEKSAELDDDTKELFGMFCKKVYDSLLESNKFLIPAAYDGSGNCINEGNFALYVACPSGWEDNIKLGLRQVQAYKEFLKKYHVPCADVVKESRAAYITARDTVLHGIAYQETPGVLIVDYGSSTIDLTWFGDKPAYTDGYELGARNVEEILFDYLCKSEKKAENVFNHYCEFIPNKLIARMVTKYGMRLQKESFFNLIAKKEIPDVAKKLLPVNLAEVTPSDTIDASDSTLRFSAENPLFLKDIMKILETYEVTNASLNNQTYIGAIIERLNSFKNNPKVGRIDYVVLTGGATKMSFVPVLIKSIFNIDENHLIVDNVAPSFAISRGVATFGVKKYYSDPIISDIRAKLYSTWQNKQWVEKKINDFISSTVQDVYTEKLLEILKSWENGEIIYDEHDSLDTLLDELVCQIENSGVNLQKDNFFYYVKNRTQGENGAHSLHALLRDIFKAVNDIDNDDINNRINNRISHYFSNIDDKGISNDKDVVIEEGRLGADLNRYVDIYFRNFSDDNCRSGFTYDIDIPIALKIQMNPEKRLNLLKELISQSFTYINGHDWAPISESSLNRDRGKIIRLFVAGRSELFAALTPMIKGFSAYLTTNYNIKEIVESCSKKIETIVYEVEDKCEMSTYTLH